MRRGGLASTSGRHSPSLAYSTRKNAKGNCIWPYNFPKRRRDDGPRGAKALTLTYVRPQPNVREALAMVPPRRATLRGPPRASAQLATQQPAQSLMPHPTSGYTSSEASRLPWTHP